MINMHVSLESSFTIPECWGVIQIEEPQIFMNFCTVIFSFKDDYYDLLYIAINIGAITDRRQKHPIKKVNDLYEVWIIHGIAQRGKLDP